MATVDLMTVEEMRRDLAEDTAEPSLPYEEERGKPMPSRNHGIIQMNLGGEFLKHREYRVISELTLGMQPQPLTPDLTIYPRQPVDMSHDVIRPTEPPLVTVEIVSPGQSYQDLRDKADLYFTHGVKSCWLVLPTIRNVTIVTPDGQERFFQGSGIATDPVIGITADLAAVFS